MHPSETRMILYCGCVSAYSILINIRIVRVDVSKMNLEENVTKPILFVVKIRSLDLLPMVINVERIWTHLTIALL